MQYLPHALTSLGLLSSIGASGLAAQTTTPSAAPQTIAWFGTWDRGLAEAKRTGRPILLISAAPHCHTVSGIW